MASDSDSYSFGPFRLDPIQGLSRGDREVRVTPKSLAVLCELVRQAGELVTKKSLFDTVWTNRIISDATLSSCIAELRKALGDDARDPRYIETVHRRGFRFLASVECPSRPASRPPINQASFIREPELVILQRHLDVQSQDASRVMAIEGEEGAGKSALVDALLRHFAPANAYRICRGSCAEHWGNADPYHPILSALTALCMQRNGAQVISDLRHSAPTWLAELTSVQEKSELDDLRLRTAGVTTARFRQELNTVLARVAARQPLLIVLEDLQWSDASTLDWLSDFPQSISAPVTVLVTRTPGTAPAIDSDAVLELSPLDEGDIYTHLEGKFPGLTEAPDALVEVARAIGQSSDGIPESIGALVDEIVRCGALVECEGRWVLKPGAVDAVYNVGKGCQKLAARRIASMSERDREILAAAALAGRRFAAGEVAAAVGASQHAIDGVLDRLVKAGDIAREFGSVARLGFAGDQVYRFESRTIRTGLIDTMDFHLRGQLHRRIARAAENSLGESAGDRSPELSIRYQLANDCARAMARHHEAASVSWRRGDRAIAHAHLARALNQLQGMPESEDRDAWEALLRVAAGNELIVARGLGDPESDAYYERAGEIADAMTPSPELFKMLWGSWVYYLNRGPIGRAWDIACRLSDIAHKLDDKLLALSACHALWGTSLMRGDLQGVFNYTRRGLALCGDGLDGTSGIICGCTPLDAQAKNHHAGICAGFFRAWAYALAGQADEAKQAADTAIAHARDTGHPLTLITALVLSAGACAAGGDAVAARRYGLEGLEMAHAHGFGAFEAWSLVYTGWAEARLGDVLRGRSMLGEGLATFRNTPFWLFRPFQLSLAAEIELEAGLYGATARSLSEAFALSEQVGDRLALSQLHRLRGELAAAVATDADDIAEAESDLRESLNIAGTSGAELLRSRAQRSLAALQPVAGRRLSEPFSS